MKPARVSVAPTTADADAEAPEAEALDAAEFDAGADATAEVGESGIGDARGVREQANMDTNMHTASTRRVTTRA